MYFILFFIPKTCFLFKTKIKCDQFQTSITLYLGIYSKMSSGNMNKAIENKTASAFHLRYFALN